MRRGKNQMKRVLFTFFVLMSILVASGCDKGPSDQELFDQSLTLVQSYFEDHQFVYENLKLPTSFNETNANLTYASSDESVISPKGVIKRDYMKNKDAELTVTIKVGSISEARTFKLTVLSQKYNNLERVLFRAMPKEGQMIYRDLDFKANIDLYRLEYEHSNSFDDNGKIVINNDTLTSEKIKVKVFDKDENFVYYVFNCKIVPTAVKTLCENIDNALPDFTNNAEEITFPTKIMNVDLTWKSLTPEVIKDNGLVVVNIKGNYLGELEASFKVNNINYQVLFNIINNQNVNNLFAIIEDDLRDNLSSFVYTNLSLSRLSSLEFVYDAKITTTSLNPEYLGDNGEYFPHEFDEEVGLEIKTEIKGLEHTFVFNLVSRGIEDEQKVVKIGTWLEEYLAEVELVDGFELPITHERYHGRITWLSLDSNVVDNNTLILPETSGIYQITAEVVINYQEKRFFFEVDLTNGERTEEQAVMEFIERSLPSELNQVTTFYDGILPEINKQIIPETAPKFYSMGKGKMKTPSQALLDQIYPGYQLPNDKNILFIVVHESGMRNVGSTAAALSNLQINRSQNGFGGDAVASWHYSVDDHEIIQNFEDEYHLYHAGDGEGSYFRGGNSNGIGIEMCINVGGNFEAAKRNNAKLIASLLHKYNLTLLNVKQHYDFSSYQKNCPETIRGTHRWYEFLQMIANEYIAQDLLKNKEITYEIEENEYVDFWKFTDKDRAYNFNMLNLYNKPLVDTYIKITVKYNNKEYEFSILIRA